MKKWEYTHRRWRYLNTEEIEKGIKGLGDEGWRLVKVASCGYNNENIMAFFEREKVYDPAKCGPFTDNAKGH